MGHNIGTNLYSLINLNPAISLAAVEINAQATELAQKMLRERKRKVTVYNCSILDFEYPENSFDFVFSCGVLIHMNLSSLQEIYKNFILFLKNIFYCANIIIQNLFQFTIEIMRINFSNVILHVKCLICF